VNGFSAAALAALLAQALVSTSAAAHPEPVSVTFGAHADVVAATATIDPEEHVAEDANVHLEWSPGPLHLFVDAAAAERRDHELLHAHHPDRHLQVQFVLGASLEF